jgi:hypothetical protein
MSAPNPLKETVMTEPGTATVPRRRQGTTPSVQEALGAVRGSLPRRAVIWAVIAFVGVWVPYVLPLYPLQLAVQGATLGLLALSVGWLRRQTGMLSFGHAMFYGFAAYAVGVLVVHVGWRRPPPCSWASRRARSSP